MACRKWFISETFRQLLSGKPREKVTTPRDHVVLDIDPVFNQSAIIQGNYKLIVGEPAFLEFDQVYPLINVSSCWFPAFC